MKTAIVQENNQVAADLFKIMKQCKTNLRQLCSKHDLDYQKYYRAMHHPIITLEFIDQFLKMINPDIRVEYEINSVTLGIELKVFLTPKT